MNSFTESCLQVSRDSFYASGTPASASLSCSKVAGISLLAAGLATPVAIGCSIIATIALSVLGASASTISTAATLPWAFVAVPLVICAASTAGALGALAVTVFLIGLSLFVGIPAAAAWIAEKSQPLADFLTAITASAATFL